MHGPCSSLDPFVDYDVSCSVKCLMRVLAALVVVFLFSMNNGSASYASDPHRQRIDDREVYIVTSKLNGTRPKIGPMRHASIAICPNGVSPIVYENGVPVSNCRECQLYGTQVLQRGFQLDQKRIGASAKKVTGVSATAVERQIRSHDQLNIPLIHDCRHHVIQVLNLRNRRGRLKRAFTIR